MFLSPLFRETLAGVTGAVIELYDTDGSVGAAKGAGIGAGIYKDNTKPLLRLRNSKSSSPDKLTVICCRCLCALETISDAELTACLSFSVLQESLLRLGCCF